MHHTLPAAFTSRRYRLSGVGLVSTENWAEALAVVATSDGTEARGPNLVHLVMRSFASWSKGR